MFGLVVPGDGGAAVGAGGLPEAQVELPHVPAAVRQPVARELAAAVGAGKPTASPLDACAQPCTAASNTNYA